MGQETWNLIAGKKISLIKLLSIKRNLGISKGEITEVSVKVKFRRITKMKFSKQTRKKVCPCHPKKKV